jgi:sodium transport system permease protein
MKTFVTIFRKEFTDTIRDRRTLFMMIVFPLLLVPALMIVVTNIQMSSMKNAEEKVLRVALIARANAPGLVVALNGRTDLRIIEGIPADSMEAMIARDSIDAAVVIAADFDAAVARMTSGTIRLFYKSSDDFDMVKRRLSGVIGSYEKQLVAERFAVLKMDPSIVNPVTIEEHDVASMKERIGKSVGGLVPYLFVIFCFMGAMYPAIDLAAGEKERGTMETLLTAPVSRFQILVGKFAVVVLTGLMSAAVSIFGILVAVRQVSKIPPEILSAVMAILDAQTVLLVLSLLLPLTVFFAAFLLSMSIYAKSYKEAQSMISPLMIVVILPVMIGLFPGVALDPVTALIPVLNVSLATKEIIAGTIKTGLLLEVYASLLVLAALSLFGCARWFEREETIFRGV